MHIWDSDKDKEHRAQGWSLSRVACPDLPACPGQCGGSGRSPLPPPPLRTSDSRTPPRADTTWSFDLGCLLGPLLPLNTVSGASLDRRPWGKKREAESETDLEAGGGKSRGTGLGVGSERKSSIRRQPHDGEAVWS